MTNARVVSKTVYKANPQSDDVSVLVLNGKALELCEIAIDGVVLGEDAYQIVGEELHLSVPSEKRAQMTLTVETIIVRTTTKYGRSLLFARHVLYANGIARLPQSDQFPRPARCLGGCTPPALSQIKLKNPILLSNGNLIESGDCDNGRHFAVWNDPHRKPAYLFIAVVTAMVEDTYTTGSGREVTLRIFGRKVKNRKQITL